MFLCAEQVSMILQKKELTRRTTHEKLYTKTLGLLLLRLMQIRTSSRYLVLLLHRLVYWPVKSAPMVKKYCRLSLLVLVDTASLQRRHLPLVIYSQSFVVHLLLKFCSLCSKCALQCMPLLHVCPCDQELEITEIQS